MMQRRATGRAGRILVAVTQPELRNAIVASISSIAGFSSIDRLKIIGFMHESSALLERTRLSRPDLLIVHSDLLATLPDQALTDLLRQQSGLAVLIAAIPSHLSALRKALPVPNVAFVTWPTETSDARNSSVLVEQIAQTILQLFPVRPGMNSVTAHSSHTPDSTLPSRRQGPAQALVIGVSTGGPEALAELFPMFDKDFPLPIAIVQHMPATFTSMLAARLNRICPLQVCEGNEDMAFIPGRAILGPGGFHMRLHGPASAPSVRLDQQPPENSCRPAVDVLFRSAAEVFGGNVITVVLTGMGKDGLVGAKQLSALGSPILVQDAATSTVWGMPGAIVQAGLATTVLPLQAIVPELMRYL